MSDYTFILPSGASRDLESDYGLTVMYALGIGMPPLQDITLDYAQGDGTLHQKTLAGMRVIHLVCKLNTNATPVGPAMHSLRKKIVADINRDVLNDSPFTFRYYGSGSSRPVDIRCMLFGGLEGNDMTGGVEDVTLELHCHDPFWRATTQTAVNLTTTATLSGAKWLIQKSAGSWAGINPTPGSSGCPDESPLDMVTDSGGILYVATSAGVYKYSASTWTKYAANGAVNALCVGANGTDIYAGGAFTTINAVAANRVAKLSGGTWSALSTGISANIVYALLYNSGVLYAGGSFTDGLAGWNGSAWSRITPASLHLSSGTVFALAADAFGNIYAGGSFTSVVADNGTGSGAVAHINNYQSSGGCFHIGGFAPLSAGADYGFAPLATYSADHGGACTVDATLHTVLNGAGGVAAVVIDAGGNYNVGSFGYITFTPQAGTYAVSNIIKINSAGFVSAMSSGANGIVRTLAVASDGKVYAAGEFTDIGSKVALWTGTAWASLSAGLNNTVNSLAADSSGVLYAAGIFTNTNYPYCAKWAAGAWSLGGITLAQGGSSIDISGTIITIGTVSPGTAPGSTATGATAINNTGNHVASPLIVLTSTGAVTIYTLTNSATGVSLDFGAYLMGAGEIITIDMSVVPATVASSANGNILGTIRSGLDTFSVSPGSNTYTLSTSDGSQLSGTIKFYASYWSADGVAA